MATTSQTPQPQQGGTPSSSQMTGQSSPQQPGAQTPIYRDWASI